MFTFGFEAKYLADSASDSSKVKQTLHFMDLTRVIKCKCQDLINIDKASFLLTES